MWITIPIVADHARHCRNRHPFCPKTTAGNAFVGIRHVVASSSASLAEVCKEISDLFADKSRLAEDIEQMCGLITGSGQAVFPVQPPPIGPDGYVISGERPLIVFNSHVMKMSVSQSEFEGPPDEILPMTRFVGQTYFVDAPVC